MNKTNLLYCNLLAQAIHRESYPLTITPEAFSPLLAQAGRQKNIPLLYEALIKQPVTLPASLHQSFTHAVISYTSSACEMESLTRQIVTLFRQHDIAFFLLKGMTLSRLYPKPELRRFGDIDIYIPDRRLLHKAGALLREQGYQEESSLGEHHILFEKPIGNHKHIIELHEQLIDAQDIPSLNETIQDIFSAVVPETAQTDSRPGDAFSYPELPPTHYALYLILHMLQHFLESGFGIKLLCDWLVFLEQKGNRIDNKRLTKYLNKLNLSRFAYTVTCCCTAFLSMPPDCCPWVIQHQREIRGQRQAAEHLLEDILEGGEFGAADSSRILIMGDSGSLAMLRTLHRQTVKRFPKASHIVPCLPFLWFATGILFLYNNRFVRRTNTRQVLESSRKRHHLRQEILPENKTQKKKSRQNKKEMEKENEIN